MAYPPSSASSSTIWLGGVLLVTGVSGGGTWTSRAIRDNGWVIMKMISSTSRISIMGTTLGSAVSAPRASPPPPAILFLLFLLGDEQAGALRLRDGGHHSDACLAGGLDGFLHFRVLELIIGLEVQDLVFGPIAKPGPELVFQRAGR